MRTINFILLPLVWMALTGEFSPNNYVVGILLSSFVLWITAPSRESLLLLYLRRLGKWIAFSLFFLREFALASLRVLFDILTPRHHMRPAILAVPLDLETDLQITMLANMLSLTPGTLSLDISPDKRTLYVHAMYVEDVDQLRRQIKERFEKRIRKVMT